MSKPRAKMLTRKQLERENEMLRQQLVDIRGCGGEGVVQQRLPDCGHVALSRDCLDCVREDARRCAYWEVVAKSERDEARMFIEHKGIWNEYEAWLADDGPEKARAAARAGDDTQ